MENNTEQSAMDALLNGETNIPKEEPIVDDNAPADSGAKQEEAPKTEEGYWNGFGEFENEEAFKSSYDELKSQAGKNEEQSILWAEKEKDFKSTIESEKAKQEMFITDDTLARLSILKASNKDDYDFYKSLVLDEKPNTMDILSKSISKKFKDASAEDIKDYIIDEYGLDLEKPNEDDFDDDIDYQKQLSKYERNMKFSKMKMEDNANSIYKEYKDKFNEIELPNNRPLSKEELVIKQNTTLEKWQPHIKDLTESVGNMSFKIKSDDGEIPIELSLNDANIEKYSKIMSGLVHDNAVGFDSDGQKQVGDIMNTIILKDQLQGLLDNVWSKAVKQTSDKYDKMISGGSTPSFNNNHKGELNTEDEAMAMLRQQAEG